MFPIFLAFFIIILVITLGLTSIGGYYIYQFYQVRHHQFMVKRYNNLSFQQLFFTLLYQFYIIVMCINMILAVNGVMLAESGAFLVFAIWLWEFMSLGILWISFIKYWHLWYDINYAAATTTHEWHKIINNNLFEQERLSLRYKANNLLTLSNSNSSNRNGLKDTNSNNNTKRKQKQKKKQKKKKQKKRRDLRLVEKKNTLGSEYSTNIRSASISKHGRSGSSSSIDHDSIVDRYGVKIRKQSRDDSWDNNGQGDGSENVSRIDSEWFIMHKLDLGNDKFTSIIGYCVIFIASIVLTVIEYLYILEAFGLGLWCVLVFIFEILPLCLLVYLEYELNNKLTFEDNLFVGKELKYLFRILVANQILYGFVQFNNYHRFNLDMNVKFIFACILLTVCTILCFMIVLFLTKWALDKLRIILQVLLFYTLLFFFLLVCSFFFALTKI